MKLVNKWRCEECDEIHDEYDDAVECCKPRVTECFLCPVCGSNFISEEIAIGCCNADELPDDYIAPPTPRELEEAGQTRLL